MAGMTPGEKAAMFLTIGEQVVELIRESGLLKPKRRKTRVKRKARKAKPVEAATNGTAKAARTAKPKRAPKSAPVEETEGFDPDED